MSETLFSLIPHTRFLGKIKTSYELLPFALLAKTIDPLRVGSLIGISPARAGKCGAVVRCGVLHQVHPRIGGEEKSKAILDLVPQLQLLYVRILLFFLFPTQGF